MTRRVTGQSGAIESIQMSPREFAELCKLAESEAPKDRRRDARVNPGGKVALELAIDQAGGVPMHWRVNVRDLSANGVGFFHRGFIHPCTGVTFTGTTLAGELAVLRGEVAWCRFLRSNVHDVGVRLTEPIKVRDFVAGFEDAGEAPPAPPAGSTATPAKLDHAVVARLASELRQMAEQQATPEQLKAKLTSLTEALTPPPASAVAA